MQIADKRTLGEPGDFSSRFAPSLVCHKGRFYIAWTGTDTNINIGTFFPVDGEIRYTITEETAIGPPCLSSDGTDLWLAWTGTDGRNTLNVARVEA